MRKYITFIGVAAVLMFAMFPLNAADAQKEAGYWKLLGTAGSTGFASNGQEWSSKEDFSAPGGATWYTFLKGKLIHQSNFTWTQPPDKVSPGQVFPFTAHGKVVFHKQPWYTSGQMTVQFYGALYPLYWIVGDSGKSSMVTVDAKVPVGNPDKTKDDHFLQLRLSSMNNPNPFRYVYEWMPDAKMTTVQRPSISGVWAWFANGDVTFRSDGTLVQGKLTGRWTQNGSNVKVQWSHGYYDFLILSADGRQLSGYGSQNPKATSGFPVSGTRR